MFVIAAVDFSIIEIVILQLGAIVLGAAITFFLTSKHNLKTPVTEDKNMARQWEELKLRYTTDIKRKDNELAEMRQKLADADENNEILAIELEERQKQEKGAPRHTASIGKTPPRIEKPDFIEHLSMAQNNLQEQNARINQLLEQITVVKEMEEQQVAVLKENESLTIQIQDLNYLLKEKESEINVARQKAALTTEMKAMLDNAYREFNLLQSKMHNMESQVASSRMINIEYDDLNAAHSRMSHEFDEYKERLHALTLKDQELTTRLHATEDDLKEANFQKQQLQKRVNYLEELNRDLQELTASNKKLEGQLRKIGELESRLNIAEEERDQLLNKPGS